MRVWIVEDEPLARERLLRMLTELGHVAQGFADAQAMRAALAHSAPEVVLLDIELPGENGLSLAQAMDSLPQPPALIFVTAYPQHALAAYAAHPIDYLLKPVSRERLAAALKAAQRLRHGQIAQAGGETIWVFQRGRRSERVPQSAIKYFRAQDKAIWAHTTLGVFVCDSPLDTLAKRLGSAFVRTHRAMLVSGIWIEALISSGLSHEVVLKDGTHLPISRRHLAQVKAQVGERVKRLAISSWQARAITLRRCSLSTRRPRRSAAPRQ